INFKREALFLAALGEVVFNFLVRVVLLALVLAVYKIPPSVNLVWAAFGVLALILFGMLVGMTFAPFNIVYKDIEYGLFTLLSVWFFMTPVVYSAAPLGMPAIIAKLNPVSPMFSAARNWILGLPAGPGEDLLIYSVCTVTLMFLGWVLFRLAIPHIIERAGSQ
ncbi:MAG: ABC transporter permease, partial [Candidatus Omnitrophica bacterium]|nr:ABC transporter permease [Candidatus Omnitrophota bacterium]